MVERGSGKPNGEFRELLRLWVPDLDLDRCLPVPIWFLMRRHGAEPRPQASALLNSGRGADARVRLALWTMVAGWFAAERGHSAELPTSQVRLIAAVDGRTSTDPESAKFQWRRVNRGLAALERANLVRREGPIRWMMVPGRGPHEEERWGGPVRPDLVPDPSVPVPLWWFHEGWVTDLSGRALITLLALKALVERPEGRLIDPTEWFMIPRVRSFRFMISRGTWTTGINELRSFRLIETARVAGTGRGGVEGDEFAYRFTSRVNRRAPLPRRRVGFDPHDEVTPEAPRLDPTGLEPPGWKPVLYASAQLLDRIFQPWSKLADLKWAFSIRQADQGPVALRVRPDLLAIDSEEFEKLCGNLQRLRARFDLYVQGDLGAQLVARSVPPTDLGITLRDTGALAAQWSPDSPQVFVPSSQPEHGEADGDVAPDS